jgi:exo-1,4-beta-D-glucosaminidase
MLNNAWPSVHWSLYDYYLKPSGGYFGTKKANEPVHIAYDYFTKKVFVVNSTLTSRSNLTATATLYNIPNLSVASTTQATLNVPANASTLALTIPAVTGLSTTYFIRLQLKDSSGAVVSSNLYWYSASPDALANKSNWYMTATKTYANLTGLNTLATNPSVTALVTRSVAAGTETATITLRNTSATNVAFFVHPEITAGNGGNEVLPVNYSDNYLSLWPAESSTITATYQTSDLGGQPPYLRVRGYNVPATSTALP